MSLESITLAVLLSAVSCAVAAQDIFAKKGLFSLFEPSLAMLHPIDGKNTLGEYPVLNVGTDLRLVVSSVSYSTPHNTPLGRAVMFSQRDKKHLLVMQMSANLIQSPGSDWTDEPCKREDLLWKRSTGKNMTDVNCVAINHLVSYFASPTGEFQQVFNLAKSEGLEFPPTALQVTFTRYAPGGRVVYTVAVNPEQYGMVRDTTTVWRASGWHKDSIARDPKKVEFLERVKRWAVDAQNRMDAAFKKDVRAFVDLRPLDEYLADRKPSEIVKSERLQSTEEKLGALKSLFSKGLLTEPQFNEQVKITLEAK